MLPRKNRLNDKEFKRLLSQGKKVRGEYGMLVIEKTSQEQPQFGFVVSKKIGNAVQRHRMTRLLREIARESMESLKGIKAVYVAYKYCNEYEKLEKELKRQFEESISSS